MTKKELLEEDEVELQKLTTYASTHITPEEMGRLHSCVDWAIERLDRANESCAHCHGNEGKLGYCWACYHELQDSYQRQHLERVATKDPKAAIALIDKWLADTSDYDERAWGKIKDALLKSPERSPR